MLEPSWTRHPSIEFLIPDDARGSPPHSANTPRMELSLSEAISFAEENAEGLDGYLNEHPEAVLWGAFAHLSGAESRVGPAEFPLVTREEPAQEWILNYESSEADEGWRVRVGISTMSVAQEEVHSEVETYDDHAVPKGFQERLVPIETRQAAFSSVASWAPLIAGDQKVIGFGAERFSGEFHGWFEQPNWQYQLIYRPTSNPPAFFASVVYVDALTGSIDRISGTIEFVEAFEDRGLG